jgi:type VI secretion system secreted protein VgrG
MAQLVGTNISINGAPVRRFNSFSLFQSIFQHHTFTLVCPAEAIEGIAGGLLQKSKNLIGAPLSVAITSVTSPGAMQFTGIVTGVEIERHSGFSGEIVISGHSATLLLDNGPHCKSWEKKAVKNIVNDVLKHFPANMLKPKVTATYPETIPYYVQYQETAWKFLTRLCSNYGEWLYFNGESLVVGPPAGDSTTSLVFGKNLSRFNVSLQALPASAQMMGYDFLNHEVYTSKPSGIEAKAGLEDLGKLVHKASNTIYNTSPKVWNNSFISNKNQQDELLNIQMAMRSSNHVRMSGSSGHPGVAIGGKLNVEGQNMHSLSNESYGAYTVISVNHHTDGQGNYNNDFVAIPASIKMPPVATIPQPIMETQSAMVTDNHDPKGLGRIRVKFHWMNGAEKTPWIRVTSPHGGGGKGIFFIPEIDEEVIVGFEGDSALKPYVIGTVYHGKANNTYSNSGNDVKALQTRSGNQMVMNDKDGSVYLSDKGGANSMMDGAGNITTNANVNSTLNAGSLAAMNVGAKDGAPATAFVTMDAGGNIVIDGKTTITIRVGGNSITISEAGIVTTAGKGKIETTAAAGPVAIKSTSAEASFGGSTNTTVGGGDKTFVTAAEVEINQA